MDGGLHIPSDRGGTSTIPRRRRNREGTKRKEQKPCRTSPEERRRRKYFAEGKSKYPFPVGLETTQVVCYQQEMASVADRTRNRTPEVGPEEEDNADDTVVAGE